MILFSVYYFVARGVAVAGAVVALLVRAAAVRGHGVSARSILAAVLLVLLLLQGRYQHGSFYADLVASQYLHVAW